MKALQVREKKLLVMLGAAVLVGLHLILLQLAIRWDRGNRARLATVFAELQEAQMWLEEKATWEARSAWLEEHLAPLAEEKPEGALQKLTQTSVSKAGLVIEGQDLRALRQGERVDSVANRLRLKGNLDQLVRWLVAVYDPAKGVAVTELDLRLGPEPPKMNVQAEVAQFFKKGKP